MKKYLLSAAALMAVASPAAARDGEAYIGVEGGLMVLKDARLDYQGQTGSEDGRLTVDHKRGFDADVIAGYDFGMFRAEAELGYKRAKIDETSVSIPNFGPLFGDGGKARAVSAMGNLLLDFGDPAGVNFFIGGGIGVSRTTYKINRISFGATDGNLAYQAIAGVRTALSPNVDAGLKYRYFRSKYNLEETDVEEVLGKWQSHSLLASLVFNFGAPPPPPAPEYVAPPAPPPPATQTCPDGSVILATEICPAPPAPPEYVPPPAPEPAPERG